MNPSQPDLFPTSKIVEFWTGDLTKLLDEVEKDGWRMMWVEFPKPNSGKPGRINVVRSKES